MADIHDAAQQWAQANPQDPRAKDIMAKAWASQNTSDPRSAQIMAKFGSNQNTNNDSTARKIMSAQYGSKEMPAVIPLPPPEIASKLGRIALNTGSGAVSGASNNPDNRIMGGVVGGLTGLGASLGTEALSPALNKLANYFKLRSVGINKDWPVNEGAEVNPSTGQTEYTDVTGVGNKLNELGIGGSRRSMASQVQNEMSTQESKLSDLLKSKDKVTPAEGLITKLKDLQTNYVDPVTGEITDAQRHGALGSAIEELTGSPGTDSTHATPPSKGFSNQGLLQLKRAERNSYTSLGQGAKGTDPWVQRAKSDWARQQIYNTDPEAANILSNEKALTIAQKGLQKPAPVSKSGLSVRTLTGLAAGSGVGGPVGGLLGAAAGAASEIPAVQSAAARAAQGGSNVLKNPLLVPSLFAPKDQ